MGFATTFLRALLLSILLFDITDSLLMYTISFGYVKCGATRKEFPKDSLRVVPQILAFSAASTIRQRGPL